MRRDARRVLTPLGFLVVMSAARLVAGGTVTSSDPALLRSENDYGIALALGGQETRAESAFVSLLSHAPGDARALNNLGNLHLLRGDLDVALAFFGRAADADSVDAGITLNASTALMLRGDEEEAQEVAAQGVRQAGGLEAAALLLGLRTPHAAAPKAGDRAYLRKEEVLALLRAATASVPVDSVKTGTSRGTDAKVRKRTRATVWRSAGVRGDEGTDITAVVYWKQ